MPLTLRERYTTSIFTLPLTLLAVILSFALSKNTSWLFFGLIIFTAYVLTEFDIKHQIIRVRSRMLSATFLALSAASDYLTASAINLLPAVTLLLAFTSLFNVYQSERPEKGVVHAFAVTSFGTLFAPTTCWLLPVLYISMIKLRIFRWKSVLASWCGIAFTFFWADVYSYFTQENFAIIPSTQFLATLLPSPATDWTAVPLRDTVNFTFVTLIFLFAIWHYGQTSFDDKIRVRTYYSIFACFSIAELLLIVLFPAHFNHLFFLFILTTSPFIAHYFTLARGRWVMTTWFIFWIVALLVLRLYNASLLPFIPS